MFLYLNDLENSLINFVFVFAKIMILFSYYVNGHQIDHFSKIYRK